MDAGYTTILFHPPRKGRLVFIKRYKNNKYMKQDDFFEGMNAKVGEFAKFNKVGDSVTGTYIGKIEGGTDGYKNPQVIYNIEGKDGKMWNVGVKLTSVNLIRQMDSVPFGYIVGIRLDEIRPSKAQPPLNPTKIINAYFNLNEPNNPKYVNLGWIATHKASGGAPKATSSNLPPVEEEYDADDDFINLVFIGEFNDVLARGYPADQEVGHAGDTLFGKH